MAIPIPIPKAKANEMSGERLTTTRAPHRVLSVDVLRGLTIALMILVNDPGDWGHIYTQLDHSEWNGLTLTDMVFPNFLFLIGVSIIFSLQSRLARGEARGTIAAHIVRRAAIIFALDLFLASFPQFHLTHLRVFGVLTRIAVCYLVVALLCMATRRIATLAAIAVGLLVGYWALMRFVPVPGFGIPTHGFPICDPVRNLTAYVDRSFTAFTQRTLHIGRLYRRTSDPEGILSTLPSIATTLFGAIAGVVLRMEAMPASRKRNLFAAAGLVCVAGGLAWNASFPINKNLWTSSYVLVAGGLSLLALALVFTFTDMSPADTLHAEGRQPSRARQVVLWPWLVFGSNAILAYCVSELAIEIGGTLHVPPGGTATLLGWIYINIFSHGDSTKLTSLAFAIAYVLLCFIPNWILWRRKIFLKI